MKIKDIRVHIINAPIDTPFKYSQRWVYDRSSVLVEVETEDGTVGWGECLCHGGQYPQMAAAVIENCYKPLTIGKDVFDADCIWEFLFNYVEAVGQQGLVINALSGLDIAIWDCIGKLLGKPVCKLLGGVYRDKVETYATGFYRVEGVKYPENAIEEARRHIANGFTGMKLKVGFGVKDDIEYIHAVREAVGPDIKLMADFNCAYNQGNARTILYETECDRLEFLEELLPPEDIEGHAALRNLTATKIATGENLFGKQNFKRWLEAGAADIYQPDLCSAGGFTECRKLSALAQAYNTPLIPHVWGCGIGLAASLQFIASLPPAPLCIEPINPMLEYDQSSHPFRLALINGACTMKDGFVEVPMGPGIGVEVNRAVIEKYEIAL